MWTGLTALFIANFIGGVFNSVLIKLGVREIPPITFTMFRFFIASLAILPFYLRQSHKEPLRKHIWIILTQAIFFAANVGSFSIAIQFTSAIMSQIIYVFVPVVVGIISYFVFKEKFTKNKIIGSLVALFGVLFLIEQSILKADNHLKSQYYLFLNYLRMLWSPVFAVVLFAFLIN